MRTAIPCLLTPGRIAAGLTVLVGRVLCILAARPHIFPSARVGTLRLFDQQALMLVQRRLDAIDAGALGRGWIMPSSTTIPEPGTELLASGGKAVRSLSERK